MTSMLGWMANPPRQSVLFAARGSCVAAVACREDGSVEHASLCIGIKTGVNDIAVGEAIQSADVLFAMRSGGESIIKAAT